MSGVVSKEVGVFWANKDAELGGGVAIVENCVIVCALSFALFGDIIPKACAVRGIDTFVIGFMGKQAVSTFIGGPDTGPR